MKNKEFFIEQLEAIIEEYSYLRAKSRHEDLSGNTSPEELSLLLTKTKASVQRIVGVESEYYKDIIMVLAKNRPDGLKLRLIIGTIQALRDDIHNDYLKSLGEIIQSDVFSNYLDMAAHILSEGYKDPAAVLIGSTLEVHLKVLCTRHSIPTENLDNKGNYKDVKTDTLNSELTKKNVYTLGYQKQITAWLDIRNNAAHGNYSEYTEDQVKLMLEGIKSFLLNFS